jgi:hypothetical protein
MIDPYINGKAGSEYRVKKKPENEVNWDDVISPGPIPELMEYKHKQTYFEKAKQQADATDVSTDSSMDFGYIPLLSSPLYKEDPERFERYERERQKQQELREFDRWLEEAFRG